MKRVSKVTKRDRNSIQILFVVFFCILLCTVALINAKSQRDAQTVLETSIRNQLLATAKAARTLLDADLYAGYAARRDTENDTYRGTLGQLRELQRSMDVTYVYTLKRAGDQAGDPYVFVFDTDTEVDTRFTEYTLSSVHESAFAGVESSGICNVQDSYGSFNSAAVPILRGDEVVGIVCADTYDTLVKDMSERSAFNAILLFGSLTATFLAMGVVLFLMLRKVRSMQEKINHMAYFDKLTDLPNRQFLLEHLSNITRLPNAKPFAMFFIDLDNFKMVNDTEGHGAGDELLQNVAIFFELTCKDSKTFRPAGDSLNVAARLGGDEFVLLRPTASPQQALDYAQELLNSFSRVKVDRNIDTYDVSLSIGIALFPDHSRDYHDLLRCADTAMYMAKRTGKNRCMLFEPGMQVDDTEKAKITSRE